jgi:hypothetical protein
MAIADKRLHNRRNAALVATRSTAIRQGLHEGPKLRFLRAALLPSL